MSDRAIIHVDMDAFFASVEQLDDPRLRGRPVMVGGTGRRGVVSAASYEARRFGVHSAMPATQARRLCPDGVFLGVRMARYQEMSRQIFEIFGRYTPEVEGLSVDEAFLDVTNCRRLHGEMERIGRKIQTNIRDETGLIASVGMATNKFLAKLASGLDKPEGFLHITTQNCRAVLDPLPVRDLWGIGEKAAARLKRGGIHTVEQIRTAPEDRLRPLLGNRLDHFRALSRGEDNRRVVSNRDEKSIGSEETFDRDLGDRQRLYSSLLAHSDRIASRTRRACLAGRTLTIKLRTPEFKTFTRSRTLATATDDTDVLYQTAKQLLTIWLTEHPAVRLRLLGVSLSRFEDDAQGDLFGQAAEPARTTRVDQVVDTIRRQFGPDAVHRAGALKRP